MAWAAALGAIGGAAGSAGSGIAQTYHEYRVAKQARKEAKERAAMYVYLMGPVVSEYQKALRGEWDPNTQRLWAGRSETIGAQSTATRRAYLKALSSRGMTGGPTMGAMRRVTEATESARQEAWRDIETTRYLQALQGISNYAATLTGMSGGGTGYGQTSPLAAGLAGAGGTLDALSQLLALRGGTAPSSIYSTGEGMWGWGEGGYGTGQYYDYM